ncbi:prolyl aminopeptidase [Oceanicoccus sagamiensis]|uniref:Proline iminopeptidase n=1 Tax=Oceanicoccus sagamiensis TaxID=716816 RepID=A0A1X9N649_9GAMM|nr:prolyl aminopeptidase [Oceanicoccus sagamiensis]ARN73568.1 prolyl aminopeptidase [Oceanicoccus sagamiensis]
MMTLYPEIKPYQTFRLAVEEPHEIYVEESGDPDGIPVLFVHGGPGGGCSAKNRCFFDPERYRIILFDQRGAGQSTPHAELKHNNTQALIEDIEVIRKHLGIEQWMLFGGSWGSTLSLLYAQSYPDRVMGLILRGIFLCRDQDLEWFYQRGASLIFPDYWQDYLHPIAKDRRDHLIEAYYDLLTGDNELARMGAAKAWSLWEGRCATLRPNHEVVEHFGEPHVALALARIEAHYFAHKGFIEANQILNNADILGGIPGTIVHGRYDMICTLDNAVALHDRWPESQLNIIRDAGHASSEPSIVDALVRATKDMAKRFRPDDEGDDASD